MNHYSNQVQNKVKFNRWTKQSIKWYLDSEAFTTYHSIIVEKLIPYISDSKTLFDIGCGVGTLSLEFTKRNLEVTAIDKSDLVIDCLKNRARQMELNNLNASNISFEDYKFNNNYDIIFVSYVMGLINEHNIEKILQKINRHLIIVMPYYKIKNDFYVDQLYTKLELDLKDLEQVNYTYIIDVLCKKNIKYDIEHVSSEFGQPFNTSREAIRFFNHYFKIPAEKEHETEEWLYKKIIKLNNLFYLPSRKESTIIII